jgi:parallel beta-helix repeat protein
MRPVSSFWGRVSKIGTASLLALLAPSAQAATSYYVSPKGTSSALCTRTDPCDLGTGTRNAQAGDYVILLDGVYSSSLNPVNSGTESAWITFQADEGALPILNGPGATEAAGVGSDVATYVRFVGIAVRNWASGFGNKWIGSTTDFSANGHWQFINCIADGNSRNGIMFSSSVGVLVRQCLIAHNGTSATSSWSSGVSLFAVQGTAQDNVIEGSVSFENIDNQKHTDGSGFIVDTKVTGASFINNIAFLNGGSGIRLTDAKNIVIANNTFYHNGRDTKADGPPNPGEIYFTDGSSTEGLTMINNVGVGSGTREDPVGWQGNPTGGHASALPTIPANNKTAATFADPEGTNPDFRLMSGSPLINQGTSTGAPAIDNGFDPKCIVKGKPTDIAVPSWSNYSIDYTYIKSIGGIAKCWKPGTRPAGSGIDIGAYEADATPAPVATGGSLPPPPAGSGGTGGSSGGTGGNGGTGGGGAGGAGGTAGATAGSSGSGGAAGSGGASGSSGNSGAGGRGGSSGSSGNGGTAGSAGVSGTGGTGGLTTGGNQGGGGAKGGAGGSSGGSSSGGHAAGAQGSAGSNGNTGISGSNSQSGCSCETGGHAHGNALSFTALATLLALCSRRLRGVGRRQQRETK